VSNLLSRVLVAAVALPVVLGVVWLGGWWLAGGLLVVGALGVHEYGRLVRTLRPLTLAALLGVTGMVLGAALGGVAWVLGAVPATLALAFLLHGIGTTRAPAVVALGSTLLGAAWIGLGAASIYLVREGFDRGRLALLAVLLADFAANTFAYFGGRLAGRHKLAPTISPGKTWEGFMVGLLAAVAVSFFALYEDRDSFIPIWQALVFGAVVAVSGALGDLFQSAIKRDMNVKDSGRLLGGHGGMLDRIDSLLFAAPAAYYTLLAFGVS
jgi:phosphatidate cytidylyltransferase